MSNYNATAFQTIIRDFQSQNLIKSLFGGDEQSLDPCLVMPEIPLDFDADPTLLNTPPTKAHEPRKKGVEALPPTPLAFGLLEEDYPKKRKFDQVSAPPPPPKAQSFASQFQPVVPTQLGLALPPNPQLFKAPFHQVDSDDEEEEEEEEEEKKRKKMEHNETERKRRVKMNETFVELRGLVPDLNKSTHKAAVLQQAVEHIKFLQSYCTKLHEESQTLKKAQQELLAERSELKATIAYYKGALEKGKSTQSARENQLPDGF